jgi:hypothetical protein
MSQPIKVDFSGQSLGRIEVEVYLGHLSLKNMGHLKFIKN